MERTKDAQTQYLPQTDVEIIRTREHEARVAAEGHAEDPLHALPVVHLRHARHVSLAMHAPVSCRTFRTDRAPGRLHTATPGATPA